MIDTNLIFKIREQIKKTPWEIQAYEDLLGVARLLKDNELNTALEISKEVRKLCFTAIADNRDVSKFIDLSNRTLLFEAPFLFDSYMQYLEINREAKSKFYLPRRDKLKVIVDALQDLADDKLDELFLSMPPRCGKSTLATMFLTWIIGRDSELSNLYSSNSGMLTGAFYKGVLEVIEDPFTYTWKTIFPDKKLVSTNAKDETLNIDRNKKYASLTCRSIDGSLNGACDCNGYLVADDLVGGIEEALNKERLRSKWSKVDNDLIPRAKQFAKRIWLGTRWSLQDPQGRRLDILENDAKYKNMRYKVINIPALDPITDESNFDYKYGVGFNTEYYQQRRASFEFNNDMASWEAQYMGEPIERSGALFTPEEMRYYNGVLPDGTPDRIFMAVDPAFGGGDYVSAPICYQYEGEIYVHDVIFDGGNKKITQPRIANAIISHRVKAARFEANNGGEGYKEDIERELKSKNYRLNITSRLAPTTKRKEMRIFDRSPEIRNFYFLESGKRGKDYNLFMQNLFSFKIIGKNKNDDAPDSLAMVCEMLNDSGTVEVIKRPF